MKKSFFVVPVLIFAGLLTAAETNLVEVPAAGMGKWMFWTAVNHQGRAGWQNGVAFIRGVKVSGTIHTSIKCTPGHEYDFTVEARPRSERITGTASLTAVCRATDGKWIHKGKKIVRLRSKQRGEWEKLSIRFKAPENSKTLYFQMGVSGLKDGEEVEFRNPRLVDLTAAE